MGAVAKKKGAQNAKKYAIKMLALFYSWLSYNVMSHDTDVRYQTRRTNLFRDFLTTWGDLSKLDRPFGWVMSRDWEDFPKDPKVQVQERLDSFRNFFALAIRNIPDFGSLHETYKNFWPTRYFSKDFFIYLSEPTHNQSCHTFFHLAKLFRAPVSFYLKSNKKFPSDWRLLLLRIMDISSTLGFDRKICHRLSIFLLSGFGGDTEIGGDTENSGPVLLMRNSSDSSFYKRRSMIFNQVRLMVKRLRLLLIWSDFCGVMLKCIPAVAMKISIYNNEDSYQKIYHCRAFILSCLLRALKIQFPHYLRRASHYCPESSALEAAVLKNTMSKGFYESCLALTEDLVVSDRACDPVS